MSDPTTGLGDWHHALDWWEIPVAEDGGEGDAASPVWAHVGWDVGPEHLTPVALVLRRLDGAPVSPALWRRMKSSEIIAASRARIEVGARLLALSANDDDRAGSAWALGLLSDEPRGAGSTKYPPGHYERVAAIYDAAVRAADTQPYRAVRVQMRDAFPDVTETKVRGWIRTARQRGLITTRARKGRAEDTKGGDQT